MIKLKDIIKESNRLNLFEQAKTYKSHEMRGTFMANYVTPNQGWEKDFAPIIKSIQELEKAGYTLDQIKVVIRSGASEAQASNRYQGSKPPKHNFQTYIPTGTPTGGLLPAAGWVPASGTRIGIPDGNAFLAAERGRQLKVKIEPLLKSKFPKLPSNFIILNPKLNSEQFASYQVQTTGEPEDVPNPWWKNVELINRGGGDEFQIFDKQNTNGTIKKFNYQLLPKASGNKERVSTDSRSTFSGADYGAGPGVGIYLSKDMIRNYANKSGKGQRWMWNYGGDPADLELAALNNHKFALANPNNTRIADVYKDASLFTSSDIGPESIGFKWTYINPSDGKLKIKRPIKV